MFKSILLTFIALLSFQIAALPFTPMSLQVISEANGLHFGGITADANSSCDIDASSTISGQCNASDPNITAGQVVISNLTRNTDYEVRVTGSNNGNLEFIASAEITGGKAGKITTTDGQAVTVTTKGNGADLTIDVYGQITLLTDISTGQGYTVDYNVEVNAL